MKRGGGGAGRLADAALAGKHGDIAHGNIEQQLCSECNRLKWSDSLVPVDMIL